MCVAGPISTSIALFLGINGFWVACFVELDYQNVLNPVLRGGECCGAGTLVHWEGKMSLNRWFYKYQACTRGEMQFKDSCFFLK